MYEFTRYFSFHSSKSRYLSKQYLIIFSMATTNGEVVMGDMDYDGRVIIYIIKGEFLSFYIPEPMLTPGAVL